jgi:uncharacterized integral membrane protein
MRYIQAGLLLLILAAMIIFAVQNTQAVNVRFLAWGVSAPLALAVLGTYILGMLSGGAVVWVLNRLL